VTRWRVSDAASFRLWGKSSVSTSCNTEGKSEDALSQIKSHFVQSLFNQEFKSLLLTSNKLIDVENSPSARLNQVSGRVVSLKKKGVQLQMVYRTYRTNDVTKNLNFEECGAELQRLCDIGFSSITLKTVYNRYTASLGKRSWKMQFARNEEIDATPTPPLAHDRQKNTFISMDEPFLKALKITVDAGEGTVIVQPNN
jgi:hypothetical protein